MTTIAPIAPAAGPNGRAAGIMFQAGDSILLVKRGDGGDYPGTWGLPGGHLEEGETEEVAARREALEETGHDFKGELRKLQDNGQFVTYYTKSEQFPVTICDESTGFVWAKVGDLPQPLHPGIDHAVRIALADTELAVAELIRDGVLPSPQWYGNMMLFDLRVTGTGTAFRSSIKEHVYRPPGEYLNAEFLARCNGLPVIFEHPDKAVLNSEEFDKRVVGTVMLPYIKGDEVWGVSRIYDAATSAIMCEKQLSTSPSVVFRSTSDNATVTLENGEPFLIEGKAALLDHLAICEVGVWDKGGPAVGVSLTNEDLAMADADKVEAKADAGADKLDKLLELMGGMSARMDSLNARMDSMEDKPAKPAPTAADKKADDGCMADADKSEEDKKADAEEKAKADAEEKAKADAEKAEEEEKKMADEAPMFADAQAKADSVYAAFGDAAPRPLQGETLLAYRKRLARKLQTHSPDYKEINLHAISDSALLSVAERKIYADAAAAARNPVNFGEGMLHEIVHSDETGRRIKTFHGSPRAWMAPFRLEPRRVARINKDFN